MAAKPLDGAEIGPAKVKVKTRLLPTTLPSIPVISTRLPPASPVGSENTGPATAGAGFQVFFTSPLVVGAGDSLSLSFVVDAVHTTEVIVSGSGTTLEFGTYFPARVFPTIGEPGIPQYYNSTGSAQSYNGTTTLAHMHPVQVA